jgi:hypothetical protein
MMLLAKKNEDKTDQTKKHGLNVENSSNTKGKNHGCRVAKIFIILDEITKLYTNILSQYRDFLTWNCK